MARLGLVLSEKDAPFKTYLLVIRGTLGKTCATGAGTRYLMMIVSGLG